MANSKSYVYSDLSVSDALYLTLNGVRYEVAQYTASWSVNDIPRAVCMIAVGRNAKTGLAAAIHSNAIFTQMVTAEVWGTFRGEYSAKAAWPNEKQLLFRGFLTGFSPRKVNGKIQIVVNLIHWLASLGFSSCVTALGHVSNHSQLNASAVLNTLDDSGAGKGNYISQLATASGLGTTLTEDLWKGVKNLFCELASQKTAAVSPGGACGGTGASTINDAALASLKKIEGPASNCNTAYKYGVALKLQTDGVANIATGIKLAIGQATVESYASTSFWDKLVGEICPTYGMSVVPMIDSAIVIADTPAYSGGVWKEIDDEYDAFEWSSDLQRPLRAVGVIAGYAARTGAGQAGSSKGFPIIGGCYVENSVKAGDGLMLYVGAPPWLAALAFLGADTTGADVKKVYERYAHMVYAQHALRGRGGNFSGKLRFDIAPGSIVQINPTKSLFVSNAAAAALGGGAAGSVTGDQLAVTMIGCVSQVTVAINAEAAMAGTTFVLSHLRTATENKSSRTSVTEHPLFGTAIHGDGKHGCPLSPTLNL